MACVLAAVEVVVGMGREDSTVGSRSRVDRTEEVVGNKHLAWVRFHVRYHVRYHVHVRDRDLVLPSLWW